MQKHRVLPDVFVGLYLHRSRVIGLPSDGREGRSLDDEFKLIWKALMESKPVRCCSTLEEVEAVPRPSVVVLDVG